MASLIQGYEYDVFISYRQKDNKYDGWVTEFVSNLNKELESMFKEEISVYFDINPSDYLLETYDVDASLKDKMKCLIFIPIISRTYCDPKSYAWDNELVAFVERASHDQFGFKLKLPNGNTANRVLPVRIHDLDITDSRLFESLVGGVMRSIDFVYKETGVNRQLRSKDDDIIKSTEQILYRDQINKVALAIREIIECMKIAYEKEKTKTKDTNVDESGVNLKSSYNELVTPEKSETTDKTLTDEVKPEKERIFKLSPLKRRIIVTGIILILGFLITVFLLLNHRSKVKWAKEEALPEIERLIYGFNMGEAFKIAMKARKYIPDDPKLKSLGNRIIKKVTILTDPPGANVYISEYTDITGQWKKIGTTPIGSMEFPSFTFYRVKLIKEGYDSILAATNTLIDTLYRTLRKTGNTPAEMVYVEGYWDEVKNTFDKKNGFFMDRFEVTNKRYKEFIDKGGYRNREYWKNSFIKNGKTITWDNALAEFTDKSGRPGPSTWEGGDYPEGQDDYPVSGISWYEAAAFAEFEGKDLPTADHWDSGVGFYWKPFFNNIRSRINPLSNFNGRHTDPVGKNAGITAFGAFDMAGNVREWNHNETGVGRIISGAGYDDANYLFTQWSNLPAWDRSPQNGFRCVRYIDKEKIPESAFRKIELNAGEARDYYKEVPVSESIFNVYRNQFLYDSSGLNAVIEKRDESNDDWISEKITFNAAYGGERVIAYLYLPKNTPPPYQTIIFFPGSYAKELKNFNEDNSGLKWFLDFVIKSGRAVLYPIYNGTFERNDGTKVSYMSHQHTEELIMWVKDFSRSVDYLSTRNDIDVAKLGFYGHSWGGNMGGIIPAVEKRLSVNILVVGGLSKGLPEADVFNYVTRVQIPTLMLNGKYDNIFDLETNVRPFFQLLGTAEKDKRLCVYDTDHYVSKNDMIKEVLAWLDRYFGPVEYLPVK